MIYLQKSKPTNQNLKKVLIIILVFLIVSVTILLFPNLVRNGSLSLARPFWITSNFFKNNFSSAINFFSSRNSLIKENKILKNKISELELKTYDYEILLKEMDDLKALVGRSGNSSRILAGVLSKPPFSPYDTFVVDAGSSVGVKVGSGVYLSDNIIIGQISSVYNKNSVVELFASYGKKQEVVSMRTGESFEMLGKGGANFSFEVPKDTDISVGDIFIYPGISNSVVGIVYEVNVNTQSSFKNIHLRIPGNVFATKFVFIEKQ